jgi:hypothetical protein
MGGISNDVRPAKRGACLYADRNALDIHFDLPPFRGRETCSGRAIVLRNTSGIGIFESASGYFGAFF